MDEETTELEDREVEAQEAAVVTGLLVAHIVVGLTILFNRCPDMDKTCCAGCGESGR